tara:strand:+ start:140 stop:307 length:168 start_codon:yes stop_codon:yes gene_type:complete
MRRPLGVRNGARSGRRRRRSAAAKLDEEARESFSVDITNNKVSHKSRKNKNKKEK